MKSGWSQLLEPGSDSISLGTMCSSSDLLVGVSWEFVSILVKPLREFDPEGAAVKDLDNLTLRHEVSFEIDADKRQWI